MKSTVKYEIQQDNANRWRVIRTAEDGVRRAWDNPPCKTKREARELIKQYKKDDCEKV
ncbi:MAG: hypothetical protein PHS93_07800 [Candidatus Omnitrophica bacterium]|nr:hypothetical protein [Candidatus Omnitrophota bacterium]